MSNLWTTSGIAACLTLLSACTTPQLSSNIAYPFQALGNEPGWSVLIDENQHAVVQLYYGEQQYQLQLPTPKITFAGTHYRSTLNEHDFNLDIVIKKCSDTMSDTVYEYETLLTVNGETFKGCGRRKP